VVEKKVADAAALNAGRDQLVLSIKQRKAQERKELFEDGLLTRLIKEGKVKKRQTRSSAWLTSIKADDSLPDRSS
jgi:hypothetical protein